MKKPHVLIGLATLGVILVGAQLVPVERTNPPVEQDMPAPAHVKAILKASCYDCHSNETVWPWYSKVAPVSWLVAADTSEGRDRLNFSTWNHFSAEQRQEIVAQVMKEIRKGQMPPKPYTLIHGDGKITPEKLAILEAWAATPVK